MFQLFLILSFSSYILGIAPLPVCICGSFLIVLGILWIQFRTEIQKIVQQTPTSFSFQELLEELPHLTIHWEGKILLNGKVVHEMITNFLSAWKTSNVQIHIQNTHPAPKVITVRSGTYKRFSERRGIGWEPVSTGEEPVSSYFT